VVFASLRRRARKRGKLLEVPGYTFHGVVTTLALTPVDAWHFYNSRADCENRLKEDFGADGLCCSRSMAPRSCSG